MRWRLGRRSANIEDRRGMGAPVGMRMPRGMGMPGDLRSGRPRRPCRRHRWHRPHRDRADRDLPRRRSELPVPGRHRCRNRPISNPQAPPSPAEEELKEFMSVVLADTEDTWHALFEQLDRTYQEPMVVLFSGAVSSACGFANAAVGPFYCPGDRKVYIDLSFFEELGDALRRARRLRPGLRPGARGRPSRADAIGHLGPGPLGARAASARPTPMRSRSARSCRPTASPASGPITPTEAARCSSRATSRRG